MKASRYTVVAFPRLDTEADVRRLRERYAVPAFQVQPHIPLAAQFGPANLDELLSVTEYISRVRRTMKPLAVAFRGCVERGEYFVALPVEGGEELQALHVSLMGGEPGSLLRDVDVFEPRLVMGRIPDPAERSKAMVEADRIGRQLALIDSLTLVRVEPEALWRPVATFPFGVGRVDYYERIVP